ncbi:hypothetical protein OAI23_01865 [Alphaproteobacteria bacterium]|nr:hypothetical protein [Alphaproteobacteria bacterium]MDC1121608.1 hypothetical protein [Alphaproteobacteria bacterium]
MTEKPTQKTADMQKLGRNFTKALLAIAIILAILEVFLHRHGVAAIEDSFMFPAIFGFFAFVFIVKVGKWLRRMIMRPEDYYGEGASDD